jgi:Tfp pilus assembly protein PilX
VNSIAAKLKDDTGIAVPIALAVLLVTLLLSAVAVAVAVNTNALSNRDTNSMEAVQGADAGVREAIYLLNSYRPDAADSTGNHCPTYPSSTTTNGSASGLCAPVNATLANGASFTYWVSGVLASGQACAGVTVDSSASTIDQRCITALGTANGVKARVQERAVAYTSTPVFPDAIFGTQSVTINNNETINASNPPALIGTNQTLTVGGGRTVIDGYQLPPGATCSGCNGVTNNGPTTGIGQKYPNPTPIDPKSSAKNTSSPFDTVSTFQGGTCTPSSPPPAGWVQTNCNYRIQRGITYPGCVSGGATVSDCDPGGTKKPLSISTPCSSGCFDPVGRVLSLGNNQSLVLGGGVYNFCGLSLGNNSQITIAPGAQASIYVDSPADPNSGAAGSSTNPPCASGTGTFSMSQNSSINGASALDAQIYVYGDPTHSPPNNTVSLQNNSGSIFALDAPFSQVNISPSTNTTFTGAITGWSVTLGNAGNFNYEADTSTLSSGALHLYYRSYWEQCPSANFNASTPTAGC